MGYNFIFTQSLELHQIIIQKNDKITFAFLFVKNTCKGCIHIDLKYIVYDLSMSDRQREEIISRTTVEKVLSNRVPVHEGHWISF